MRSFLILSLSFFYLQVGYSQTPSGQPEAAPVEEPITNDVVQPVETQPPSENLTPPEMTEELNEANGIVMKKNTFTYDGAEGRDPFKVFREVPLFLPTDNGGGKTTGPIIVEKNIRTALVPNDVVVLGILFKKNDPIALVRVRDVKGLNKLRLNSPVGRNEGKVIEIHKDRIVIEQVKDFDGQKFTEKVTLKVREKKN